MLLWKLDVRLKQSEYWCIVRPARGDRFECRTHVRYNKGGLRVAGNFFPNGGKSITVL